MVRPDRTISPHKEVRRSIRERTTVYRSLAENHLGNDVMHHSREYRSRNHHHPSAYARSARKIENYYESDDNFPDQYIRRTRSISRQDHEDENSPIDRRIKRRKLIVEEESEQGSLPNEDSRDAEYSNGSVKPRDEIKSPKQKGHIRFSEVQSPSTQVETRLRKRGTKKESHDNTEGCSKIDKKDDENQTKSDDDDDEISFNQTNGEAEEDPEDEQDEEATQESEHDEAEPRQYKLRQRRPMQQIRMSTRNQSRPSYREKQYIPKNREHPKRSEYKNRMCRSDSSSTGSEDEREMRRKVRNDDARFEKRKERSMIKARNRFIPINLTEKDLSSSQAVIRERMRQTGASCSDVDPMSIDQTVGFDEIGGLGPHIQSLKEVVLFPLLYPDIFQNFNINPPKGVLFYGPPGTGKTLVARALANECSRGNKKVAFFMRKGADCLSKWVGESERQLRILFDQAYAMRPSIIFFDEIDGLAPVRSTRQDQIHSSIVSTLLALMDGLDNRGEVIVIGATNRLDSIDPALRRPGRFDRELRFSLPDSAARLQILKIHTSKWDDSKPDEQLMHWLSQHTSGYCGADLKYLCTEAVMISLRNQYPHIYMSHERLKLDLSNIKVTKEDLLAAMKRITPASRRDLSIPCRPLDERTSILLATGLQSLLDTIPEAYKCSRSVEVTGTCELEKIVRALEEQPPISAVRILLNGHPKYPNSGQTSYVLPALLSKLDHLPVHCISISKLFADGRPEEAFATIFQSALRSAAIGPCILLCPSIDEWFKIVPLSVMHMLKVSLDQITGFTPILFLATVECSYADCAEEITKIFRVHTSLQIPLISVEIRRQYFEHICANALEPPKIFDPSKYVQPEIAKTEDAPTRRLSEKEAKELEKLYENQLREFRIFLRDQLGKLCRDRRFIAFMEPVDIEEAEDYYEIIKEPMCFTQMQEKVDRREYTHPDQFLADIKLIVNNALEYNPVGDSHSKLIRHSAIALRDIVEEYFEKEFDEDFVDDLESTARLLLEAKIVPQNEQLLSLPDGFVRKSRWNVVNGFKGLTDTNNATSSVLPNSRMRMFRGSTYKLKCNKKRQKSRAIVQSIAQSLNQTPEAPDPCDETQSQAQEESSGLSAHFDVNVDTSETTNSSQVQLTIDECDVLNIIDVAVQKSSEWPIPELEALGAAIVNIIDQYRNKWERSALPGFVISTIEAWEYDPQPFDQPSIS